MAPSRALRYERRVLFFEELGASRYDGVVMARSAFFFARRALFLRLSRRRDTAFGGEN